MKTTANVKRDSRHCRFLTGLVFAFMILVPATGSGQGVTSMAVSNIDPENIGYSPEDLGNLFRIELEKKGLFNIVDKITRTILFAQNNEELIDTRPLNSININFFGDASLISFNYERQFIINSTFILTSKLGLGYNEEFKICINLFGPSDCSPPDKYLTIPHHITGNLGKGQHFFEFGLGGTIINGNTTQPYLLYPIVGYRILPLRSGKMNFRIFIQIPFSGSNTDDILWIPFGLSFGISSS